MAANELSVAESDSFVLKLAEMVERRVEGVKVMLPKQLKGNEPTQKMAVIFYATWAKLEGEESISAGGRLRALADNVNQSHALDVYLTRLNVLLNEALFTPSLNWTLASFHDARGRRMIHSTFAADPKVLLPVGDINENWNAAARREDNIHFVQIKAKVDLSSLTGKATSNYTVNSFVELPMGDKVIHDGTGAPRTSHTFLGANDMRTYDAAVFKSEVLEVTGQTKPGDLSAPGFAMTDARLDCSKRQDKMREYLIGLESDFLKGIVFDALCPNLEHRPESALNMVKQIYVGADGNRARISMSLYMTNLAIAASCLGHGDYTIDVVDHGLQNMDPDVKEMLLLHWDGHRESRTCDAFTQTKALLQLSKDAQQAEASVLNTKSLIDGRNKQIFASIPGFAAAAAALPATGGTELSVGVNASQAENTLRAHANILPFDWKSGCWICGKQDHMAKDKTGAFTCPQANAPNAQENFDKNMKKFKERKRNASKKRGKEPRFEKMNATQQRAFVTALTSNKEIRDVFNSVVAEVQGEGGQPAPPPPPSPNVQHSSYYQQPPPPPPPPSGGGRGGHGITLLPVIPVLSQ